MPDREVELPAWASPKEPRPTRRGRRRFGLRVVAGVAGVLLCTPVIAGTFWGYRLLKRAVADISRVPGLVTAPEVEGQPITYLIVGSDSREFDLFAEDQEFVSGQRADVIMLAILDPRRQAALLLSIPRDTVV